MRQYIKEYPAILEERYAFVDGGYLRSKFYERMEKAFGPDDIPDLNLDTLKRSLGAIRIFFYDSQKDDDGQTPLLSKQEWINRQLEAVRKTDTYRLRLGTHSRSGKRSERPEQKEVDVLLAVDLLSNSYARNMKEAVVLTGDLDFRPALEEVVRHGTRIHLLYDGNGVAQDLLDVADKRQALTFEDYYDWTPTPFRVTHPLPEVRDVYERSNSVALVIISAITVQEIRWEPSCFNYGNPG